ncbi:MmpS family transport accessory protein [Streptomyces sp. NPDC002994]|uniref:MmpS family transport accessory protein n=1 Tax=Streptomyces sp. NPDC002994 TaxID=3154441 RepID=UPI0033B2E592
MSDAPPPPPGDLPPPGWAASPPPPEKKRRVWPWVLLGLLFLFAGGCVAVIATVATVVDDESNRTVTVKYVVTGDAKGVTIAYTTWRDGNASSNTVSDARLPWRKEVETSGFAKGGSLTVTTGASGSSATCSVTVDSGEPQTATATGRFATATCDDF